MLPPFYYKGVPEEGLYRSFAEVIERVGDARLQLYLYHIPPVSQVPITLGLIERLLKAYPGAVAGIKDSSGDWNNTKAVLDAFAKSGFDVFAGSEVFLLANMRGGGKGCITATGNVNPGPINRVYENWRAPEADALQAGITATRGTDPEVPDDLGAEGRHRPLGARSRLGDGAPAAGRAHASSAALARGRARRGRFRHARARRLE